MRIQPWVSALMLAVICLAAIGAVVWWRSRSQPTAQELLSYITPDTSAVMYIDVAGLRRAGLFDLLAGGRMAGGRVSEEPEYKEFVDETGFDYQTDVDALVLAFAPGAPAQSNVFAMVQGRFDWRRLMQYASKKGGACHNGLCRMPGSVETRKISFLPIRTSLMALAVSEDPYAVTHIGRRVGPATEIVPSDPIWMRVNVTAARQSESLPTGLRAFLSAMEGAERALFTLGAENGRFRVGLEVNCSTPAEAESIALELRQVTERLKKMIALDKQHANPADLSGVLTAGTFRAEDRRALGHWPVERAFVESVAGGGF